MKKFLLSLSLVGISLFGMSTPQSNIKEKLKNIFYSHSQVQSLASQETFNTFIKPYMAKAEKLNVIQYLKNHPEYNSQAYVQKIEEYNYYFINKYYDLFMAPQRELSLLEKELLEVITKIKSNSQLDFNVKKETDNTVALIKEINEQYFKQISFLTKIKLYFFYSMGRAALGCVRLMLMHADCVENTISSLN